MKSNLKKYLPWFMLYTYQKLRGLPEDIPHIFRFIFTRSSVPTSFWIRLKLVYSCYRISYSVECPHMEHEIIEVMEAILNADPETEGVVVEAGAYKGGSGAKLSLAAAHAHHTLYIFDSFEGIPENTEVHGKNIYGGDAYFPKGSYSGSREEVEKAIRAYGRIDSCEFIPGWFDDTMPHFSKTIIAAYIDVDLQSSTRTCLTYLYPLLTPGSLLFSQDGHLPLIISLLRDTAFWNDAFHISPPPMEGLGIRKLVKIIKK